jgi:DNA-binding transcriptional LysR family regulator
MQDWNDWLFFLKLAEFKNMKKAAQALKVDNSTIFRKINNLEERIKVRLFERLPSGYKLTAAGEGIIGKVKDIEESFHDINFNLSGKDANLSGKIKISTSDTIGYYFLPKLIKKFNLEYPQIIIDLEITNKYSSLAKRESDIVITTSNKQPDYMVGRKLSKIGFALYGDKDIKIEQFDQIKDHKILMPGESLSQVAVTKFLNNHVNQSNVTLYCDKFSGLYAMCKEGMGLAALPHYLGGDLHKIIDLPQSCWGNMWILTHPELRKVARIKIFMSWMSDNVN